MKIEFRGVALAVAVGAAACVGPVLADIKQNTGLAGQGITLFLPDAKHPGWMLWKLWVRSGYFASGKATGQGVTALLFAHGKPDARLTAPKAVGDTNTKKIVASGGVEYVSLTQKGTSMKARTVTWNADTKQGVAQGNVHYQNGKSGLKAVTSILYFDSGLNIVSSEPLGGR